MFYQIELTYLNLWIKASFSVAAEQSSCSEKEAEVWKRGTCTTNDDDVTTAGHHAAADAALTTTAACVTTAFTADDAATFNGFTTPGQSLFLSTMQVISSFFNMLF